MLDINRSRPARNYLIVFQDRQAHRRGSIGVFLCETEEAAIGAAEQRYPQLFIFARDHDWTAHAIDNGA